MPNKQQTILILIGPIGVGKSHICRVLEKRDLCQYFSIEEIFMERYGTLDNFQLHKDEAYAYFEQLICSAPKDKPIIFEESGINTQATQMIRNLNCEYHVILIEVRANLDTCLDRVNKRGIKHNFPKDKAFVKEAERRYLSIAQPKYHFNLSIENNALSDSEIIHLLQHCLRS